jgi:hypothetical protein
VDAIEVLSRLQGMVKLAVLTDDDNIWFSVVRRVSMAIAIAVGRQLSSCLPGWEGPGVPCAGMPDQVIALRALGRCVWM